MPRKHPATKSKKKIRIFIWARRFTATEIYCWWICVRYIFRQCREKRISAALVKAAQKKNLDNYFINTVLSGHGSLDVETFIFVSKNTMIITFVIDGYFNTIVNPSNDQNLQTIQLITGVSLGINFSLNCSEPYRY